MSLVSIYEKTKKNTKNWFNDIDFSPVVILVILAFIIYSIWVRYQDLGYSEFQGDEVNPMTFLYGMSDGILKYLLAHKRGPMQYIINIINVRVFGYHSEWQIRLPFFVFGTLAFFSFYKLASKIFDKSVGLLTVFFLALNGLFIAFARITQYQAVMYFIIPIGVYWYIKALELNKYKMYILSGLLISLSLLAHYDTLSVMPFFIAGFLGKLIRDIYYSDNKSKSIYLKYTSKYVKYAFVFFTFVFVPALLYYIPFFLGSYFNSKTSGYLENRLLGGGFMPRTSITLKLISMYSPRFAWYLLFLFGIIAIIMFYRHLSNFKVFNISISEKIIKITYILSVIMIFGASIFSLYPVKPRTSTLLVVIFSIITSVYLIVFPKVKWTYASLASWFLGSYSFYWFLMKDPRTHVYVSVMPLFILAAYGFVELYRMIRGKYVKGLYLLSTLLVALYISTINWAIFVDKSPEYPWWDKNDIFGKPIYRIQRVYHKKIDGVFGFNHYRSLHKIAELYNNGCLTGSFNSNEKDSITYFYLRKHQKQGSKHQLEMDSDNIIFIYGPHSWVYEGKDRIPRKYVLLKVFKTNGYDATYIYGLKSLYPNGKLLCE